MPDPKLKLAMEEMKEVLKKHDIVGSIILASPTHLEYLRHYQASWSYAWLEPDGLLRVKLKREMFNSKEEQKKALEDTVGTFAGLYDAYINEAENMQKVIMMVGKQVPFDHHTSHE
jgi:rhamnose utilization protein RhaD (predicted bifunctional aldolase and dehydrogenase)